ncbi:hypothetical protein [Nubsella zeaxanthinifaciens]|jgi:hypothetical protein|uniref:hypothetical protein n=1 Tax=Nubsella zeaxanthinifaciens TaxID=392412 RepID=UPI000DE3CC7B|nr:hypothetical protein [Nubsella zeaxanthinifaciens]
MNRILAVFLILISVGLSTNAQQVKISLAPEVNLPTGNAASLSGIGFGASLKTEFGVSERYAITASGAYNLFITKNILGSKIANINAVPVKLGLKHYASPDFYIEGQAGAAFSVGNTSGTSFVWSPGFGTLIKTGGSGKLDFGLRYESWANTSYGTNSSLKATSFNFIGLKLGYIFGL